jgi:Na+-transporting methylmalonyl-CoA/oxaloacetate decarboxylase gamma subunit
MNEIPFYKRLWFGVVLIAIFLILTTIYIGYKVVNRYEKERDEATTKTISEILKQESKAHPLLPDVLVINVSAKDQQLISDSIRKEVSKFLIDRYTQKSDDTSQADIHPYVSFLEKNNNKPITAEQVAELKKHIEFLVENCNKAVEDSKRNIDTEISKINTWVTIWIGVFGLLGIFIPIVVNLKSFDALKEIETKANAAESKITEHKEDIEAIAGIKAAVADATRDIATINTTLPALTTQSATALQNSTTAIAQSELNNKVLIALNAIGKLKKLEKIIFLNRDNPIPIIHSYLSSVLNILRTIDNNHNQHFYTDLLEELKERLFELSYTTVIRSRNKTVAISEFAVFINNKIASPIPLTNIDHDEIVANFESMLAAIL